MEQLLGNISIGLLLRSLFAGVFFVAAYLVASGPGVAEFASTTKLGNNLALSLFSGVVAYAFHRSMIYPFLVEWWMNHKKVAAFRSRSWYSLINADTIKVLTENWDATAENAGIGVARSKHLATWADFVHLQLASALCIALGAAFGTRLDFCQFEVHWPLFWIMALQLLAGLTSDWRLHRVREAMSRPA